MNLDDLGGIMPDVWRIESSEEAQARQLQEEHGGLGSQLLTGVESGLGAATLGGYDVVAGEIGGEQYRRERAAREQANPLAATTGEVVGTVAPLLASGGTSLAARGVAAVGSPIRAAAAAGEAAGGLATRGLARLGVAGESVLGRGVQQATRLGVGGAVEGAVYGAGQELSEAALAPDGNYDRLGERLLAGAKEGAKFGALAGGTLGLGLGVGGGLASSVARRVGGAEGFRKAAGELSEFSAVKAIDPSKKASRELVNTKRMNQTGRELLDNDIVAAGRSTEEMLSRATAVKQEAGERIGAALRRVDEAGGRVDASKLFSRVDELTGDLRKSLSVADRRIADKLDETLSLLKERTQAVKITSEVVEAAAGKPQLWREFLKGRMGPAMKAHGGDHTKAVRALSAEYKAMKTRGEQINKLVEKLEAAGGKSAKKATPPAPTTTIRPAKPLTFEELHQFRARLDADINWARIEAPPAAERLRDVRRILEDTIETQADEAVRKARAVDQLGLKNAKQEFAGEFRDLRALRQAYEGASPEQIQKIARGEMPPMGSVSGRPLEPVRVHIEPNGTVHLNDGRHRLKVAEESGATEILANVRRFDEAGNVVDEFTRPVSISASKGEAGFLKEYQAAKKTFGASRWAEKQLTDNLARGQTNREFGLTDTIAAAGGLVLGGGSVAGLATGAALGAANKLVREKAAGVIAVLADRVAKADVKLSKGVRKFLRPVERATRAETLAEGTEAQLERKSKIDKLLGAKKGETRTDAYRRKLAEITENAQQGPAAIERKLGNIASVAPNAAVGMAAAMSRGTSYLQQVAPTGLIDTDSLVPHLEKPQVDPVSVAKFARAVQVVEDPLSVFDELEAGTLTRDHVQALRTVYPDIYNDIRLKVADELSLLKQPPAFERRIQLGTLLDLPTDKSLRPSSIAAAQAGYQQQAQTPPPEPPPLPQGTMAETLKTESQKLASGGLDQP
jgi:hypothetical protein